MSLALTSRKAALLAPWLRNPLWAAARAVPSLDLRFADSKSLVDATTGQNLVTFTRASEATFVNSQGQIQTAAINAPRFDHNPVTGESLGLLVEEQRTNLSLRSQELGNAAWTKTAASITAGAIAAPDGTTTADKLVEDSSTGSHSIIEAAALTYTSGVAYTFSFFVKRAERQTIQILMHPNPFPGTLGQRTALFNSNTGAFASVGSAYTGSSVATLPNDWYRVSVSSTADATTAGNFTISLCSDDAGTTSYAGNGTSGIYLWGAQLEAGAFPTSYIPTTGTAATRSADVASISGSILDGGAGNTLFSQFRSPASGTRPIVSLDDNTANERIELFTSGTDPKLLVTDGGSAQADIDAGAIVANTTARLAARFAANNFAASVSGGEEVVDTSGTMPTVGRVRIGSNQAGGYLNGTIARLTNWKSTQPLLPSITQ